MYPMKSEKLAFRNQAIKDLRQIPGVGPSIAQDLIHIGIYSVQDLIGKDP